MIMGYLTGAPLPRRDMLSNSGNPKALKKENPVLLYPVGNQALGTGLAYSLIERRAAQ
jgi:hypothetical protein